MNKKEWIKSVYSDGSINFVSNPQPSTGDNIKISIQIRKEAEAQNILLNAKYNGVEHAKRMEKVSEENGIIRYETEVKVYENEFRYYFIIACKKNYYFYTQNGITTNIPDESRLFRILVNYRQPSWVKSAVFYQIFPDRFCNGTTENDVKDNEYIFDGFPCKKIKDWNSVPEKYEKAHCLDFYGGDLQGIQQKIQYLKELGVTAVYLNPIFYGATVHKYDCLDYFQVDPHFGGNKSLEDLTDELHKNGMKIILDVSINHTGIANKWFNRDGSFFPKSEGAYNNPDSKERDFYFFNKDNTYKAWFDVETLPTLNYTSDKLRSIIYKDADSLVKKYLKTPFNTDGWRFDVADTMARNNELQLHHTIWPEIAKSIKDENKDAYILAEDWSDCTEFLNGNEWDSPMNYYGSSRPIRQFFGETDVFLGRNKELKDIKYKMTAKDISNQITGYLSRLPFSIQQNLFNLIDSHDTPRFHNNKSITKDKLKGALIMLFTLPGCTNIYYGDEAEIDGTTDSMEGARYPMPWNKDIKATYSYKVYSTLSNIKRNGLFANAGFKVLYDEGYTFCYARFTNKEVYITVANQEAKDKTIKIPVYYFNDKIIKEKNINIDELGDEISAEIKDGYLILKAIKGKSYLIKLN